MQVNTRPVTTAAAYYAASIPAFALVLGTGLFAAAYLSGVLLPVIGATTALVLLPLTRRLVRFSGRGRFSMHFIRSAPLYFYVIVGLNLGFGGSFDPETASLAAFILLCLTAASGGAILFDVLASWFDMRDYPARADLRTS